MYDVIDGYDGYERECVYVCVCRVRVCEGREERRECMKRRESV